MHLVLVEYQHFANEIEAKAAFQVLGGVQFFDEAVKVLVPVDLVLWVFEDSAEKVLFVVGFESFHARAK